MPSQFFGLTIASSGLRASNAWLNTTANNISNAQTVGYSRQQVLQQASSALRTFATYGCAGAGVEAIAIERVRDGFYDMRYWNNNCKYGQYEVKAYYTKTIEEYFKDDGKSGFKTLFDKMSANLQSVVSNSSSDTSKADFIASAKAVTDYFNNMYGNLRELQTDINLEIKLNVDQINSISEKIATLNQQINVIEQSGSAANELRDQRDKLIDDLSEIVDVETLEMPIYDANDPTRETGGTRYMVKIAGGQPLVDGNDFNTLAYKARSADEKVNQTDIDGLYDITWANGNSFSLNNAAMDGKLKGLVELRDGNNGSNFEGKVTGITAAAGTDPTKVTIAVSAEYLKSMQNCTLSDTGGKINIGNKLYYYSSWEFDPATKEYTFTMDDAKNGAVPAAADVGKEAKTESKIDYQGIPYYMAQMNSWIRGFAEKVNDIFTSGTNSKDDPGCIFFTGNKAVGGQYTDAELDASAGNGLYELTAGNITIYADLLSNSGLLGTRTSAEVGVEECGKIQEMIDMLASKEKFSFRNGTAGQMLDRILSDAILNASNADTFCETYLGLKNTINNQRNSISGVDEDEEAVSLVKYQNSYTLASKMIQTLSEIYDRLILQTGV